MRGIKAGIVGVIVIALLGAYSAPAGAANREKVRRPGPLRVLLVGDSITVNYQNTAATALRAKGNAVTTAGVASSGLLDANQCNGGRARLLLDLVDPDVVVFENTGNYGYLTAAGIPVCAPAVTFGSKAFFKEWKKSAKLTQRILTSRGARFMWMLVPINAYSAAWKAAIPGLNTVYRQVAGKKAGLVDAWTAFGGATYNPALHDFSALHLSPAGITKMSNLVVSAVG